MKNKSAYIMLGLGILSQVLTFVLTGDAWISFISGIAGVVSVVLCSERRISYYIWSFIQLTTYAYICWEGGLYGKFFENIVYFVAGVISLIIWRRNIDEDNLVKTKELDHNGIIKCCISFLIGTCTMLYILNGVGGNNILLDAVSTTLAIIAQVLMMLRYKENWIVWFIVNILCIILWSIKSDWCMVMQYVFWTGNTVYGYNIWKKSIKN